MHDNRIPAVVLGGTGYVAAELIRLISGHPSFSLAAVASTTAMGERIDDRFPYLTGIAGNLAFSDFETAKSTITDAHGIAVFSALPHGETGPILSEFAQIDNVQMRLVDLSADFRFADIAEYERVYGHPHPAPELQDRFFCGLPELTPKTPNGFISHPGCFTTAVTLGMAPLVAQGVVEGTIIANCVTGSTGSGSKPKPGTHHPERHGGMWAYDPLKHRHQPEMRFLLSRLTPGTDIAFLPHSGPFTRGIHATLFAGLSKPLSVSEIEEVYTAFYDGDFSIRVGQRMPSVKEVAGSNRCHIGIAVEGNRVVVTSVIDNLVKGAAGGSVKWMNRLFGLPQEAGLIHAGLAWA